MQLKISVSVEWLASLATGFSLKVERRNRWESGLFTPCRVVQYRELKGVKSEKNYTPSDWLFDYLFKRIEKRAINDCSSFLLRIIGFSQH